MPSYGRLNITIDSSLSAYATQIDDIFTDLQGVSAADDLFSGGPTVNINIEYTSGDSGWDPTNNTIWINTGSNLSYIDFFGNVQDYSLARIIVHELGHGVLGLHDPLPYGAPTQDYLDILEDPESDLIGNTVFFENAIMASSPFAETGRAHYFNDIEPNETIPERLLTTYTDNTAVDVVVHGTVAFNGNIVINRDGSVIDERPTDDLIIGYNSNETIFAGGGNDVVYDGSGVDVLEGGEGDDIYRLSPDAGADIVIVGQGSDTVSGASGNDLLVLRGTQLGLSPDDFSLWDTQATGISDGETGIPLLGGFIYDTWEGGFAASYAPTASYIEQQEYFKPENPNPFYRYRDQPHLNPLWEELSSTFADEGNDYIDSIFDVEYVLDNGVMTITVWFYEDGTPQNSQITIEEFETGDFGLSFVETSVSYPPSQNPIYYDGDADHVAFINNNGSYVTIPEEPL